MAANVTFRDLSLQVQAAIREHALTALETAANEMTSQVKRRTREPTAWPRDVKGSWNYDIDKDRMEARIGSPLEESYWEELGTGEYAINRDGRKGWWVYVKGENGPTKSTKQYTYEEALQMMASMRADGLDAHISQGRPPGRPMQRAFDEEKQNIIAVIEDEVKRLEDEKNG